MTSKMRMPIRYLAGVVAFLVTISGCSWRQTRDGPVGSAARPLVVGLVAWPGYAAGIYANGGFKTSQESIFGLDGIHVRFLLIEDIDARGKALAKGGPDGVDIVWSTVDFLANEAPNFERAGIPVIAFLQVDWSSGGDALLAGSDVNDIRGLLGKKIALVQFTPSHWLLEHTMDSARMSQEERIQIRRKLVFSQDLTSVRQAFVAGQVDAAVLWEPEVSEALKHRTGSHVIASTASAPNLIADVMITKRDFAQTNQGPLIRFARGWMEAAPLARRNIEHTTDLLMNTEALFHDLGAPVTERSLSWVHLADQSDNARMFGLDGKPPEFDRLFAAATRVWTELGYITTPLQASEARDDSILRQATPTR